jgi:hypothetical protein
MTPFWANGKPVQVQAGGEKPETFRWSWRRHNVRDVNARWRIHALWWTESEVWRDYWEVTTDTGLLCVLYRDLRSDGWYLERVYE